MVVVVLHVDPPVPGGAFARLVRTSPLSAAEAATLYRACCRDVARTLAASGGDLLVNYPPADRYPDDEAPADPERAARELLDGVEGIDDARFEVQVGSSFAARLGNTVTHLLEREERTSVIVARGDVPLLVRTTVDGTSMRLRSHEVVLGPAERGRVYLTGFREPIDFADADAPPELATLARRGVDAGHEVDILPQYTRIETGDDLLSVAATIDARRVAGRAFPSETAAALDDMIRIGAEDGRPTLDRANPED